MPAWYLHTTDAVVLAGPFTGEAAARMACARYATKVGEWMRRDGGPSTDEDVRACVAKLHVGYGVRPEPHGRFQPVFPTDP